MTGSIGSSLREINDFCLAGAIDGAVILFTDLVRGRHFLEKEMVSTRLAMIGIARKQKISRSDIGSPAVAPKNTEKIATIMMFRTQVATKKRIYMANLPITVSAFKLMPSFCETIRESIPTDTQPRPHWYPYSPPQVGSDNL